MHVVCPLYNLLFPASISVIVIPNHTLKVLWEPVDYAHSFNMYIVNTTIAGLDGIAITTTVTHPITNANQTGLPQYSVGTVSVWAMNPGALSEPVIKGFKMVNIATNGRQNVIVQFAVAIFLCYIFSTVN